MLDDFQSRRRARGQPLGLRADPPPHLATQLTALVCSLRGSVCIFQGEELGLGEAEVPYEALRDPYGIAFWPHFKGRDGCRTPHAVGHVASEAAFSSATAGCPCRHSIWIARSTCRNAIRLFAAGIQAFSALA